MSESEERGGKYVEEIEIGVGRECERDSRLEECKTGGDGLETGENNYTKGTGIREAERPRQTCL